MRHQEQIWIVGTALTLRMTDAWAWHGHGHTTKSVVTSPTLMTFKTRLDKTWKKFKFMPVETEMSKEKLDKTLCEELLDYDEIDQLTGNQPKIIAEKDVYMYVCMFAILPPTQSAVILCLVIVTYMYNTETYEQYYKTMSLLALYG